MIILLAFHDPGNRYIYRLCRQVCLLAATLKGQVDQNVEYLNLVGWAFVIPRKDEKTEESKNHLTVVLSWNIQGDVLAFSIRSQEDIFFMMDPPQVSCL
jgi:hypothetical protein